MTMRCFRNEADWQQLCLHGQGAWSRGKTNYLDVPATVTIFAYDTDAGYRRITATSPAGGITVTRLEANGTTHDITRADGSVSSYLYDGKGQLASVTTSGVKTAF